MTISQRIVVEPRKVLPTGEERARANAAEEFDGWYCPTCDKEWPHSMAAAAPLFDNTVYCSYDCIEEYKANL